MKIIKTCHFLFETKKINVESGLRVKVKPKTSEKCENAIHRERGVILLHREYFLNVIIPDPANDTPCKSRVGLSIGIQDEDERK